MRDATIVAIINASIFWSVNSKTNPLVVTLTDKFIKKTIKYRNSAGHY